MAKNKEVTTKFKADITDFKKNIQDAKKQIALANSEFKLASAGMDNWSKDADGLSAKLKQLTSNIDSQNAMLSEYEKRYEEVVREQGEGSKAAYDLQITMNNLKTQIKSNEAQVNKYSKALNELGEESEDTQKGSKDAAKGLDDLGDSAKDAEQSSSGLTSALGSLVKGGLAAVGAAATAAIGAFLASAEATREYTTAMGKLDTAFTTSGHTVEAATETYQDLVGLLGETDQAVEAANHIAKLVDNEKDMQKWTDICTGVFATFGDSLPIEGLTEAANETAKTGVVTGALADALNWAGVSEDTFNAALSKATTEQERQAIITKTLTGLYGEASDTYKEVNADIIANNKATDALNASMAEVGKVATPIVTTFKQMGASLLSDLMPSIKEMGEGFKGLIAGTDGAAEQLGGAVSGLITNLSSKITSALPEIAKTGVTLVTTLLQSFIDSLPQMASSASAIIGTLVEGITQAIPLLLEQGAQMITKLGEGLSSKLPEFVNYALDALDGFADMLTSSLPVLIDAGISMLTNLAQGIANALPTFIVKAPEIISKFANLINDNMPKILMAAVNIIVTLVKGIIQAIPTLVKNIPKIITAIVDVWEAFNWLSLGSKAITAVKNGITKMLGAVKGAGSSIVKGITGVIQNLPSKLLSLGKNGVSGLANALKGGVSNVIAAAGKILTGITGKLKPSALLNVGKDLIKGLWNGVSNMTGWIIGKLESFGDSVLSGIKSFFGIASPSKEMQKQVGKPIAQGVAKGIEDNSDLAVNAAKGMGEDILDTATDTLEELDEARDGSLAAELKYWKAMTQAASNGSEEQAKALEKVKEAEEKLVEDVSELMDNYKSQFADTRDSFLNATSLFEGFERKSDEDKLSSNDLTLNIAQQVQAYEEYWRLMKELKGRITSEGLNAAISEMGVDSLDELNALNAMTDEQLEQYALLYDTKYALCNEIASDKLTGLKAETETQLAEMLGVSAVNLDEFSTMFNGSLDSIKAYINQTVADTSALQADMYNNGVYIVQGLINGMKSQTESLAATTKELIQASVAAAKAGAQIKSPSRLFANEIGKYIPLGIAQGITKNTDSVKSAMDSLTKETVDVAKNKIAGGLSVNNAPVGASGSQTVNNYTFNQTNNSPKALSRLELYRQSKNLLGYAGGGA